MIGVPDTFFIKGADCWGWATWARSWELFELNGQKLLDELQYKKLQKEADFNNSYGYSRMLKDQINGKNNSWAIRWYMSCFLQNKLTLYPKRSYIQNIGNDDSGTHCSQTDQFFVDVLSHEPMQLNKVAVVSEDANAREYMEKYFRSIKQNLLTKIFKKIKRSIVR
jgi:hypothetical protein